MNIGLLGCGVVGGGILDFCAERADLTVARCWCAVPGQSWALLR